MGGNCSRGGGCVPGEPLRILRFLGKIGELLGKIRGITTFSPPKKNPYYFGVSGFFGSGFGKPRRKIDPSATPFLPSSKKWVFPKIVVSQNGW